MKQRSSASDNVMFSSVPDAVWSGDPIDKAPASSPEKWVDDAADKLEIQRLTQMQVLAPAAEFEGETNAGGDSLWILETYLQMLTGAPTNPTDVQLAVVPLIKNNLVHASSRSQKVISLSSCESELHSMVSGACDGIFIKACAAFVLGEEVQHLLYTDSSSARQLASTRARHLSRKVLRIQEKNARWKFGFEANPDGLECGRYRNKAFVKAALVPVDA
eukprot:s935_g25.t1